MNHFALITATVLCVASLPGWSAVHRTWTADEAKLARAVELMEQAGSIAFARAKADGLVRSAKAHLAAIEIVDKVRETLISMADFFVERRG